jgi:hypothetical protein
MSTLVAIGYNDADKAEEVRLMLRTMKKDYLIDIEDAVVAVKDEKGKIRLNQSVGHAGPRSRRAQGDGRKDPPQQPVARERGPAAAGDQRRQGGLRPVPNGRAGW